MTLQHLQNLEKIGRLKREPPDLAEINGLLESAKRRLKDAAVEVVSEEGRFLSACGAAQKAQAATQRKKPSTSKKKSAMKKAG